MKEIVLNGKAGGVALVDDDDFLLVSSRKWHLNKGYAASGEWDGNTCRTIRMHRLILSLGQYDGRDVDHINGNKLDNRRSNLRTATRSQNLCNRGVSPKNTSGYKGVRMDRRSGRWMSQIGVGKQKKKYLGMFKDPKDAARAYDQAAIKLFGEFAVTNFQEDARGD